MSGSKNPMFGRTHTEEAIEKISKANKGTKRTEEFKKMRSKKYTGVGNPNFGKGISELVSKAFEEHREKQRVKIKCNETGVMYSSITEAANSISVSGAAIGRHLVGKIKKVKGFSFSRVEDKNVV